MLRLRSKTASAWTERAIQNLDEVLIDHAHCERKAAGTAINLLFRYPDRAPLQEPLSALAREELIHFDAVLRILADRGTRFSRLEPSPYANDLLKVRRAPEPERLLDTLIICAMIEARSCERMALLADHAPEPGLRAFYRGLLESEARHHSTYVTLARQLFADDEVETRLEVISTHEAEVLRLAPPWPRMHT